MDKSPKSVTHGQCNAGRYGYLPSRRAPPPLDRYQTILLGDRGTCVRTTCPRLLPESGTAGDRTRDLSGAGPIAAHYPLHHQAIGGQIHTHTHTHTHTHPLYNGPLSGTTLVSRYQKGKTNLDFTEARDSGSGIRWAVCKSAPRSRQITTRVPHRSVFYRPDALPAAQPTVSKH